MNLFVFSSKTLTNIWAGIGAGLWAISEQQAANVTGAHSKARQMRVGSSGIIYCSDTQFFTTPFLILSKPADEVISNIWPEPWTLPFKIHALGTPRRYLHKDELVKELPVVRSGGRPWNHVLHIQPTTVFVPSEVADEDWEVLVDRLGER